MKVLKGGTDEQIEQLNNRLEPYDLTVEDYRVKVHDDVEYFQQIAEKMTAKQNNVDHTLLLSSFIQGKMGLLNKRRPSGLDYMSVRRLVWTAFVNVVSIGNNIHPDKVKPTKAQEGYLRNITNYILGDPGEWNPQRSLYLYGDLGCGKSTLAHVLHFVTQYIEKKYEWNARSFSFCSMDELFLGGYTSQKLDKFGALADGFFILDELREEHSLYKHFGNDLMILNDVMTVRYNLWVNQKIQTVITSNMNPAALMNLFDDNKFEEENKSRLNDRIKQQYQCIWIEGANQRALITK